MRGSESSRKAVPQRTARGRRVSVLAWSAALSMGAVAQAHAAVTFRLDRLQASPGETVRVEAIFFNEGNASVAWAAPKELILQWRDSAGTVIRSRAPLEHDSGAVEIPAGRFSQMSWTAVVPQQVKGLQAIGVEGEPVLLALDTSTTESGSIAGTRAYGPIIDPSKPAAGATPQVADSGVLSAVSGSSAAPTAVPPGSPNVGPAPDEAVASSSSAENSALERFRSSVSSYEPIYFSFGTRGDTTARFQISLKYRFLQPTSSTSSSFIDNLYFGYTQTSLWDLSEDSAPFRDSSYRPSFFWLSDNLWESANRRWSIGADSGFEHESNGQAGDQSRSINSLYAHPAFRYRLDNGSTLSFAPKIRAYLDLAGNPDLAKYRGHVDYQIRWAKDDGPMVSALLRRGDDKGSIQLDLAYPLRNTWLSNLNGFLHLQYFNGYGETLLGYNVRGTSQLRVGLMIVR